MEHFCWFIKLLFLLLMMLKVPTIETRALRDHAQQTDIIAGNEFLKLFLERDELQRQLHSNEYQERGGGRGMVNYYNDNGDGDKIKDRTATEEIATISNARSRSTSGRSLESKSRNANEQTRGGDDSHKSQVVKLVTSGSKIVFLEDEYDEEDAVADAVEIELKKERKPRDKVATLKQQHSPMSDEVKVVAVSVSSSSQRAHARERSLPHGLTKHMNSFSETAKDSRHEQQHNKSHNSNKTTSSTSQPLTAKKSTTTTTTTTPSSITATSTSTTTTAPAALDFINRSHKSEFLIEEAEPLTMLKNTPSFSTSTHLFYDTDSENSASTNIRNVLAIPASATDSLSNSSARNVSHINQSSARSRSYIHGEHSSVTTTSTPPGLVEDKLLPFQTVIYHDTKEGHGPQSRSISYSSISQNVEDLQAWQKSGILAEAQRNVSESLKPLPRPPAELQKHTHTSEPAKFYSLPSQMYSVPAKFYSEPAKVYSEPAKVYGQPEKVYSEPAKVYGQPSKFYSEPAKVYSQPSKVYSEPAKTYWPRPLPAATTSTTTAATTSSSAAFTTTTPAPFEALSSRRPAIVSRIAFGEAQTTQVPTDTGQQHQTQTNRQYPNQHSQNIHHHQQQQQQKQQQQHHQHHHQHLHDASHGDNPNSQPRRVFFNLDRLPYDLLNAPEQTPEHHIPSSATAAADNGYNVARPRPCWEPPSLLPTSSTTSQQHQPHSSLLDQHSYQNAKGLPNRDLVKCVSKYSHSSAASLAKRPNAYTTEHSHIQELYTPTPEQNYEIEESVSVMTNGRAHGVQVFGGPTTVTTTTRSHMRGGGKGGDSGRSNGIHHHATLYNTNANANVDDVEQATDENYDEDNNNEGDADDVNANASGNNKSNNGKDDSKVAYVLEGRNFRKYRVEEKTDDGFIVGEYGVVDHQDGNLRGVRYTADSTINRSLIQKALLTFLKLK